MKTDSFFAELVSNNIGWNHCGQHSDQYEDFLEFYQMQSETK